MPERPPLVHTERRCRPWRLPALSPQALTLMVCLAFTFFYNQRFWAETLAAEPPGSLVEWGHMIGYGVILTLLHCVVFLPFINRVTAKPLLSALLLLAAGVSYFTGHYGVYFDTHMIDNVVQTDTREATELLTPGLARYLVLYAALPLALLWLWPLRHRSWRRGLGMSLLWLAGAVVVLVVALLLSFQSLSPLMRNHHELRFLVTPGNAIVSTGQVLAADDPLPSERLPIGEDARRQPSATGAPRLMVLVVGETVRAANWGLSGYARQTTPKLAERELVNFPRVSSCGTSTAVSLPCMFARRGRRDYDERDILSHESLLDVLRHAGFRVLWIDNQSGCKGVCDGVERRTLSPKDYPEKCRDGTCLDEVLVDELERQAASIEEDTVVVLHMLGNHGPSYSQRYPEAQRVFTPTCEEADLARCTRESIVNSYDNAVRYTDNVLDAMIEALERRPSLDAALLYVSDHGESLGEGGIFLHGLPYAIAPDEQTRVPMIWWSSPSFDRGAGLDSDCLARQSERTVSHDHLFHTLLGVLGVESSVIDVRLDITQHCRRLEPSLMAQLDAHDGDR
ncbi:phosphoethanolamine--lipid A transferase [Billgrantia sulfidoxydans]|uniref:Phosphoethanolamine--lipid A transferase n=1 Tax=Billgrantia sulfidoxydans TaxID=2733484 RepID=A0ABX7W2T0_9GAMM|nr:phosphoethanolamine--lipid A transferase [Halomonas sulfidoxydans]QTP54146.1 phosphoethanolamine--lipid A transferase [Halomonas sulfidoxydans]